MIHGSLTAIVTPFTAASHTSSGNDPTGAIDESALRKLVERQIEAGTHGLVPTGTTGEAPTLTAAEHQQVIEIVCDQVQGRVPVVAGAGSNNTAEAIKYSQVAAAAGADATLHAAGYYNRPHQEGLFQHFAALSANSPLPMIVYNIPPRSVVDILPDTMARIAALPGVIGVKDATCDLARPGRERLRMPQSIADNFRFLSGEDATAVAYNAAGGVGCISTTANVAPALCAQMQNACTAGDYRTAADIQQSLMPLHEALFLEPSPAGAKYACSLLQLCAPYCRLPCVELTTESKSAIESALRGLSML